MVADLIQMGADVNGNDENGRTPLMNAASNGSIQIMEMLIDAGANPGFVNDAGENALRLAANKDVEAVLRRTSSLSAEPSPEKEIEKPIITNETTIEEPTLIINQSEQELEQALVLNHDLIAEEPSLEFGESKLDTEEPIKNTESNMEAAFMKPVESEQLPVRLPEDENRKEADTMTAETERLRIRFIEEKPAKKVDALSCLQCGGTIGPNEINCSHCQALIMRRYCSHCSKLIPDHATICPLCGKNVREHFLYSKLHRAKILIGAATAVGLMLLLFLVFWRHTSPEPRSVRARDVHTPQINQPVSEPEEQEEETNLLDDSSLPTEMPNENQSKPKMTNRTPVPEATEEIKQVPSNSLAEAEAEAPVSESPTVEQSSPELSMPASTQRALELNDQQRIKRGRFLNSKGYTLIKAGRPSEAIPLLEQSVRSFPEGTKDVSYAYALFNLGVAWRMAGRPDIAIPILEERIKINNQRDAVQRELLVAKRQARESGLGENEYD